MMRVMFWVLTFLAVLQLGFLLPFNVYLAVTGYPIQLVVAAVNLIFGVGAVFGAYLAQGADY